MNLSQVPSLDIKTSNIVWKNIAKQYNDYYDITKKNAVDTLNEYNNIYNSIILLSTALTFTQQAADLLETYYAN